MTDPIRRTTVLVNLTWLVPGVVGGSEESTTAAVRAVLAAGAPDVDLRLAVLRPFLAAHPDLAGAVPCEVLDMDGRDKARRVAAEQTWLALVARRTGAEVVHHAGGVVPLVHPGRVVLTIHDLQPLELSQNFSFAKRSYIRTMVGRSARSAEVVCVPSEFTASRVVQLLGVERPRVQVVPWSVPPGGTVRADDSAAPLDAPYLLYPAISYAHKNHLMLLDAFAEVSGVGALPHLVLTGAPGPLDDEVDAHIAALGLDGRVHRRGRVPAEELAQWYRHAAAVVVPSNYEGFGLPALEAMAAGTPVLASDAGALREFVAPEDLVHADDVTAWAAAMQAVLSLRGSDRAARVVAGRTRAAEFTPERTATALLAAYRRAAGGPVITTAP